MVKLIVPPNARNMVSAIMTPAQDMMRAAGAVILLAELEDLVIRAANVPHTRQSDELAVLVAERISELRKELYT